MFACEVQEALTHALVASEMGILSDPPTGITAQQIGIACRIAQRRPARIVGADTGEDLFHVLQTILGIALDDRVVGNPGICQRWGIRGSARPARVINKQRLWPVLSNGRVLERLHW